MSTHPNGFSRIEFDIRVKGHYEKPAVPPGTESAIVENFIENLQRLSDVQDIDSYQGLRGISLPLKYTTPLAARAPRLPTDFMPKAGCGCRKR